jgi:oxalate decarboxylase/phosphoglucose isomerase-like protein (cupin superfamily)
MFSESLGAQGMWWHPAQEKVLHLLSGYATMILFSESYGDSPDNSEYESARRLR